jgi:hypothetical protein
MKVYIFGAGASLGSQDSQGITNKMLISPLVDDLFNPRYETYASDVFLSPTRIRSMAQSVGDQSLEEWLSAEWTKLGEPHGKEALAYGRKLFGDLTLYIWWMMSNISGTYSEKNGYYEFLEKLRVIDDKEEQVFVNFNYDLLLDKALVKAYGYNLSGSITNYTTLNYLKPHGSVNWFLKRRSSDEKIERYDRIGDQLEVTLTRVASNMFKGDPIEKNMIVLNPLNTNLNSAHSTFDYTFDTGSYGFPLVMLPLASKMYDLVNDFMQVMNAEFARVFSQATEVYVIGYRANDDLFAKMTKHIRKGTVLNVVSRGTGKNIQENILNIQSKFVKGKVYNEGFSDFIKKLGT